MARKGGFAVRHRERSGDSSSGIGDAETPRNRVRSRLLTNGKGRRGCDGRAEAPAQRVSPAYVLLTRSVILSTLSKLPSAGMVSAMLRMR